MNPGRPFVTRARLGALVVIGLAWVACTVAPRLLRDRDPRLAVLVHAERTDLAMRLRDASATEYGIEFADHPTTNALGGGFRFRFEGVRDPRTVPGALDPWDRPMQSLRGHGLQQLMYSGIFGPPVGSVGPNGVDEGCIGDDVILVGDEAAILVACGLDLGPLVVAALAWLLVGPWRAAPRARFAVECGRAIVRAAPLAFVAYASSPALSEVVRFPAWLEPASNLVGSSAGAVALQVLGAGALVAHGLRLRATSSGDDAGASSCVSTSPPVVDQGTLAAPLPLPAALPGFLGSSDESAEAAAARVSSGPSRKGRKEEERKGREGPVDPVGAGTLQLAVRSGGPSGGRHDLRGLCAPLRALCVNRPVVEAGQAALPGFLGSSEDLLEAGAR